ncbi:MAG: hypothetical protein ABIG68_01460 [Acidobacteriota bacterium]
MARPIDPILGVKGLPRSATGQTTLRTGINAQARIGQHLTGFPNAPLREVLLEHSVLKVLRDRGLRAVFIDAFRPRFFQLPWKQKVRLCHTPSHVTRSSRSF